MPHTAEPRFGPVRLTRNTPMRNSQATMSNTLHLSYSINLLGCNKPLLYYIMLRYTHLYKPYFVFPMIKVYCLYITSSYNSTSPFFTLLNYSNLCIFYVEHFHPLRSVRAANSKVIILNFRSVAALRYIKGQIPSILPYPHAFHQKHLADILAPGSGSHWRLAAAC